MSLQKPILLKILDNEPIGTFCSVSQELCFSYDWSLQLVKNGANGNPLISLEISNDNVNWNEYHECAKDVLFDDVDNTMRFIDEILPSRYFRICVKDNGVTTGTIDAIMYLKRK